VSFIVAVATFEVTPVPLGCSGQCQLEQDWILILPVWFQFLLTALKGINWNVSGVIQHPGLTKL